MIHTYVLVIGEAKICVLLIRNFDIISHISLNKSSVILCREN